MAYNPLPTLEQVLAYIGRITEIVGRLKAANKEIPGVLADATSILLSVAKSFKNGVPPANIGTQLSMVQGVLGSVETFVDDPILDAEIADIIRAVSVSQTSWSNLVNGQFAEAFRVTLNLDGTEAPVGVFLARLDEGPSAEALGTGEPTVTTQAKAKKG